MIHPLCRWSLLLSLSVLPVLPSRSETPSGQETAPAARAPGAGTTGGWIDDRSLQLRFERGASQLIEAGRAPEMARVRQGLAQKTCTLTLPRPLPQPAREPGRPHGDAPPVATGGEALYEKALRSVVVVGSAYKCDRCSNWHVGGASGFVLTADGAIVTNHHVVDQADKRALFVMTGDGRVFPVVETLAGDSEADVAIVRIDPVNQDAKAARFEPLPLASASRTGQRVRVVSHPDSRHYVLTEGVVSRRYVDPHRGGSRWMTITADYARGSSGGPLFNDAGEVIGIVSSTAGVYYDHDESHQPRNLQMVWKLCVPVENIRALVE